MGNTHFGGTLVRTASHEWRRQFHCGWVDAQNGEPWPGNYEAMSRSEQIAYESARLLVREAIVEGFAIPIWRGDKAGALVIDELWGAVCRRLGGRPTPPEWIEPAPLDVAA